MWFVLFAIPVDGSSITMSLVDKSGKRLFDLPTTTLKDHGRGMDSIFTPIFIS